MSVLLELYPSWLAENLDLKKCNIIALQDMCPPPEDLNKSNLVNSKKKAIPLMRNEGRFDNTAGIVERIDHFVLDSWGFGHFVRGVIEGDINLDTNPKFREHMKSYWNKFIGNYNLRAEEGLDMHGFVPAQVYEEEEDGSKGRKSSTTKGGTTEEKQCKKFVKLMKELLVMDENGIDQKFKDEEITTEDAKEVVAVCMDNGLVDKVVLKEKENLNYWSAKWEENTPLEPTGAKKLQSMAIRATSKN
jgi:hypothetical protein